MVTFDRGGALGVLTLASPPQNLLTSPAFCEPDRLRDFLSSPDLTGVLVRGEGRHFCGGADLARLAEQAQDPAALARDLDRGKLLLDALRFAPVPVVAAIRGQCLGAGFEIALACHFRVASTGAMVGFPESTHGLLPGLGGTLLAAGREHRAAIDLVVSGRLVESEEALALGLVDRVVSTAKVEEAAEAMLAALVAEKPPALVHALMEALHNARRLPREEALRRETALFCELLRRSRG